MFTQTARANQRLRYYSRKHMSESLPTQWSQSTSISTPTVSSLWEGFIYQDNGSV